MSPKEKLDKGISIVVPVYNSQDSIDELVTRLNLVLSSLDTPNEIILVNDGSMDKSWEKIKSMKKLYPWVMGINLMRNYGQHNALLCGIRAAQYSITVTMDDDLQHPPEEITNLLPFIEQGYDVVYGTPQVQKHALWRKISSLMLRLALQGAMGVSNARNVSSFRAFRTSIREAFAGYHSPFVFIDVLLTWGTTSFYSLPVNHDPRKGGKSNYNLWSLILQAVNMTTGYTVLPLQLSSLLGFGFALFGLIILVYVVTRFIYEGGSVPGFPFLASIIAIFSGVMLFSLGIIGEYLARMHFNIMEKPSYVVRIVDSSSEEVTDDTR